MDLKVLSPVPDLINITYDKMHSSLYSLLDNLIQEHKTTLIFVKSIETAKRNNKNRK